MSCFKWHTLCFSAHPMGSGWWELFQMTYIVFEAWYLEPKSLTVDLFLQGLEMIFVHNIGLFADVSFGKNNSEHYFNCLVFFARGDCRDSPPTFCFTPYHINTSTQFYPPVDNDKSMGEVIHPRHCRYSITKESLRCFTTIIVLLLVRCLPQAI